MELLERIEQQLEVTQLPLFGITLAAVPCPDTPIILTLHWHGFVREKLVDREEAQPVSIRSVPSSALQVNDRWSDLLAVDRAVLEAAWELGAWDIARAEQPACMRPGADSSEALECLKAFGAFPFGAPGERMVVSDAPDADDLLQVAAQRGYLMWTFRPVHGGIWKEFADDVTLRPDGTREPPCPVEPIPPRGAGARRTVYRFGMPEGITH
ncbi:MAG TPA: diguanylate cyclase [Burkholderiales bacterium]|nr:diguanylate cyclase [Burkholderiales bacterium]